MLLAIGILGREVTVASSYATESRFTLDECLQEIRQSREKNIRSAIMDIRVENRYDDPAVPVRPADIMKCYIDGEKMRRDTFEHGGMQVVASSIWSVTRQILRVPESERGAVSVMVDKIDMSRKRHEILAYLIIPDIRFLGTYLFWNNMYNGNGWILTPEAIFGMERPLDVLHDSNTRVMILRWECRLKELKREFRAIVHPGEDWSVSKIELVDLVDEKESPVIVTSIRNKEWEDGVVFPELIITDYYDESGVRYRTETIAIENARFNIPIPESVFEVAGMGLPERTLIFDETVPLENSLTQWSTRDGKAVPWTGPPQEQYDLPTVSRGSIIVRIVCMILGILMIIFAVRMMWKGKHNSE